MRSAIARLLLGGLTVGCTVGPRTPVPVGPAEPEPQPPGADEEDFRLPEAMGLEGVEESMPPEPETEPTVEFAEMGAARVHLGDRPPWGHVENPSSSAAPPAQIPVTWSLVRTIQVGEGYLHQAAFVPGTNSVVTLSTDSGTIYQFDFSGKALQKIPLPGFRQFDDAAFAVLKERDDQASLLVARPQGLLRLELNHQRFETLAPELPSNGIEPTGRPGLHGISHRKIDPQSGTLWLRWSNGDLAAILECRLRPDGFALSPDGRYLAVSYYPGDTVEVLDLQEEKVISRIPLPKWGSALAISPDGRLLAMGGEKLQVMRFPSGELVAEDTKYGNNIGEVRFTPQGDLLLASAFDGRARSYALPRDLSTMTKLPPPQALRHLGQANVYALGLSEDGRQLVTSSGDKTLKLWRR